MLAEFTMRRMKIVAASLALLAFVGACESKQTTGTVVGAVGGGVAGHALGGGWLGAAAGALIGGLLGSQIGKHLDKEDVARAEQANQRAMDQNATGQSATWSNPNTGASGTVTPTTNAYVAQTGETCREFQQTVSAKGSSETARGRACKQPDGSWKVVN
jgi:surface antigen